MKQIVSIITPSFNRADLVTETADSIFAQTYPYWEWVIVEDGSTDNSWEVLQAIAAKDSRVKIFQRQRLPKGACACRNIAVENCTGDYVMFLDTDDVLAPYCLEQRVAAMQENPDCDFVIFPMLLFENELMDLNVLWNIDKDKDDIHRILTGDAVCQGTGPLWKKSSFQQVGMWREDLALWQDVELHIRSLLWPMKYVKRLDLNPDVYLRVSYTSLSRSGYYTLPKIKSRMEVLVYTYRTVREKGVFEQYRNDVSTLANDIVLSAIVGGHYSEAKKFLAFCRNENLFDLSKYNAVQNYLSVRKSKLSKIKAVDSFFYRKARLLQIATDNTIGKISWKPSSVSPVLF
ncbi:glycosyltransferase family 2 protein [Flavisolibacter ginsenosidimutans]|uniref:Glycosyltransferase family 2 protein n=1 Tax=Flavisolibacter ginsenosidimutans TaxID=661481 RepID=A0A5B8UDX0_9BACT|nr:glycosyltransferase family A protein [Flavisolibacter ginsenosidimutans]QEC54867.1 glycosyltransferase family 2 protein [Flavisolibacter ginsenosidimutans]